MNVHELPMILFTVIAQLCVGAFIVLGLIQLIAGARHDRATVERLTEPVVYAIGPAMVFGLAASTLHMNDVSNTLNVFRNLGSSWLSREIVFGMAFAGLGFAFALVQWFKIGTFRLRQLLAALTALAGIALVWAMSQIYYTLVTVPAWHTPIVPFHFFATTLMLGAMATACALITTTMIRHRREQRGVAAGSAGGGGAGGGAPAAGGGAPAAGSSAGQSSRTGAVATLVRNRVTEINAPTTEGEWQLTTRTVRWLASATAIIGVAVLISYPLHIADLATDPTGATSAQVFSGAFFVMRLVLLALATVVLAIFVRRTATQAAQDRPQLLAALITTAFVLAFVAELMGRSLHYDSMIRIGI